MELRQYEIDHQLVKQFAKDDGIRVEDIEGILHADVIVSRRYWKNHLAPFFYKEIYHKKSSLQ